MVKEVKSTIHLPSPGNITPADSQDMETLDRANKEPMETVYIGENPDEDTVITLADGSVTKARQININGVSWLIPVETPYEVPRFVKEHIDNCRAVKNRAPRITPNKTFNMTQNRYVSG